ncbi:hypothetical protein [Acetobacter sp. DsW_063]|uniref:hypothetical protein n=1 Tax=Acetobacter sp. DsW_063 TaxID=1514894 RepID=UPI0013028A69|nr:hypothetical protein [Acetobacter sp. DsW_063]
MNANTGRLHEIFTHRREDDAMRLGWRPGTMETTLNLLRLISETALAARNFWAEERPAP